MSKEKKEEKMDDEEWYEETMRRANHKNMTRNLFKPKEWQVIFDFIETAKDIDKDVK